MNFSDSGPTVRVRPITIAILAMGGEGGGVLANWVVDLAEHAGYLAQMTSVPGVAQRTGATIYYVELFPKSLARDKPPVLALMPVPGDVDIVLASELMEAGRAITRGFVTRDRTTLITSTHRVYTMLERTSPADDRADSGAFMKAAKEASRRLYAFDMVSIAEATGSVLNAVMFGALAGCGGLPFQRAAFEATIRRGGLGVEPSMRAFVAGFETAASGTPALSLPDAPADPRAAATALQPLLAAVNDRLSTTSRPIVRAGVARLVDYQGERYANLYLSRLAPVIDIEAKRQGKPDELLSEVARNLALAMAYEDTIRVAELKIRASRFARVREEAKVQDGELLEIVEYMHPRAQEIADAMPSRVGQFMLRNNLTRKLLDRLTSKGRKIKTSSILGFLLLYAVASTKPWRPMSLRWQVEQERLAKWLEHVVTLAHEDYHFAVEVAHLIALVKGYGET